MAGRHAKYDRFDCRQTPTGFDGEGALCVQEFIPYTNLTLTYVCNNNIKKNMKMA